MHEPQAHIYEFGDFRVDAVKRLLLRRDSEQIPLTPKVFDTLLYLVRHAGKVIEKDELMREIWADTVVEENNLSQNISILRRILGEKRGEHRFIATIPGKGFKFVAEVRRVEEEERRKGEEEIRNEAAVADLGFEIADLGFEIADLGFKSEERRPKTEDQKANEKPKTEDPITINDAQRSTDQIPNPKSQIPNRKWRVAALSAFVVGLGLLGFYAWRANPKADAAVKTIAVLPFKPLVAENRDEALEMGMADTLIARLGDNREIVVRPMSSVRRYGGLEQDAGEAGRALGVDSVLDGSIQRWGDKIRVNARLIKTADGTAFWTGTFDEKFMDIFVVQDAIAKRVAAELALKLSGNEQARLEQRSTNNAEAYEFYLRGRYHYLKITPPEIRRAIGFYEQAIRADPNYARSYAAMADAYRALAMTNSAPSKEVCPQAKALARRALEIDESLADARVVLGWVGFLYDWDWENAEKELQKAVELAPNNSESHRAYAHLLSNLGRHEEAITVGRRARELDPLTLITAALEGQFLFYAGRHDEAIARFQKILEIDPNFWVAHNHLGRVYMLQGRYAEAIAAFTKARELSGGSTEPVTQLGYALAKSGNRKQARVALEELKSFAEDNYVPAYNFAMIYNGLGEKEEALGYLEKSFEEREAQLTFIKIDTRWNDLRSEPRFVDLMRRMNFD